MKKTRLTLSLLALMMHAGISGNAQPISPYGSSSIYTFNTLDKFQRSNFIANYKTQLGLGSNDALIEDDFIVDDSTGDFSSRHIQRHKGYDVEGASLVLHGSEGVILSTTGNVMTGLNVNVTSPISESTALSAALTYLGSHNYEWNDSLKEANIKELYEDSTATLYPKGNLVISVPANSAIEPSNYKLMWKFNISYVDSPAATVWVYVDAINGDVENTLDAYDYATGSVNTIYDGTQPILTARPNGLSKYQLKGLEIRTTDASYTIKKDADNIWNDNDDIRVEASGHWAAQTAQEYYSARHGRWSVDGKGRVVYMVPLSELDRSNIGASGIYEGKAYIRMGRRVGLATPATLDMVGHEYTHHVIRFSSKLNESQQYLEAGALNEGFSDILGQAIEEHMRGVTLGGAYKVGEDLTSPYPYAAYRNFADPFLSTHPQPKIKGSTHWDNVNSSVAWHRNAGVITHWYYLMAHGGTTNGITVTPIGKHGTIDLVYNTAIKRLWSTANFDNARNEMEKLAIEWWGYCSWEHKQLIKAWTAVGVGSGMTCVRPATLTGPHVMPAKPAGPLYVPAKLSKGQIKLVSTDPTVTLAPTSVQWDIPSTWTVDYGEDNLDITITSTTSLDSRWVTAYVTTGTTVDSFKHFVHFTNCEAPYCDDSELKQANAINGVAGNTKKRIAIYPNPSAEGFVNLQIPDNTLGATRLIITDITGREIKRQQLNVSTNRISTAELNTGIYLFQIIGSNFKETHKVFVK